ncbi:MAG: ATP-binding protein [Alphaproteobacteria bacterium]|nr:ATP-binding protein [Alphaproteobacteria bacterium]
MAVIDRLTHHCHLETGNTSWRLKSSSRTSS